MLPSEILQNSVREIALTGICNKENVFIFRMTRIPTDLSLEFEWFQLPLRLSLDVIIIKTRIISQYHWFRASSLASSRLLILGLESETTLSYCVPRSHAKLRDCTISFGPQNIYIRNSYFFILNCINNLFDVLCKRE